MTVSYTDPDGHGVSGVVIVGTSSATGAVTNGTTRGGLPLERLAPTSFTWTPTIDTSGGGGAYANGDSLYTTVTTITSVCPANGGTFLLEKLTVVDLSTPSGVNNPSALDVLFFNATMTPAAANAANAISDGDIAKCIGFVPIGTYTNGTINAFGQWNGQLLLPLGAATTSLFICVTVRGTPTYGTAGDLVFTACGRALA